MDRDRILIMYHYSPSQNAFYPDELKQVYIDAGSFPGDTIEVGNDVWLEFAGNNPPEGKQRAAGHDGMPCWVDIPLPDIEYARKQKHAAINAWRDAQENGKVIFTWNNHQWDASKASQDRITPVLELAATQGLPEGFFWTDANNNDVPVTSDDLRNISEGITKAIVEQGWKIHERQRQMKKEINSMTSVTDILNYSPCWE
ncbi:DUF4376 domain-containing protein [Salmonella enterica]|nr:DUF4376 domain-containing protein [Salmonella enterica]